LSSPEGISTGQEGSISLNWYGLRYFLLTLDWNITGIIKIRKNFGIRPYKVKKQIILLFDKAMIFSILESTDLTETTALLSVIL